MVKKLSALTIKVLFGLALLDQSATALTLNGTEVNFSSPYEQTILKTRALTNEHKTIIAKFNAPLSKKAKERFYNSGVSIIVYAGGFSYYIHAKESVLDNIEYLDSTFVAKADMRAEYRMEDSSLATFSFNPFVNLNVLFLEELSDSEMNEYFELNDIDATIVKSLKELKEAKIRVATSDLQKLKELPLIQYMDKSQNIITVNGIKETRNAKSADSINVSKLWGSEYGLNGENIRVGVVDGGSVRDTHQEFNENGIKRVINKTDTDTNFHATHVSGTIIGDGDKAQARGMAKNATLFSYGFSTVSFSSAILELYKKDGVLLSNHSYGYSDKVKLGIYDSEASIQDKVVYNNPFINVFEAAGNDGDVGGYEDFGIIKGPGNSKNIFTIGALNMNSNGVAKLSSTGPARDGRIKPDLVARGEYVNSATDESDTSYASMSGTSMATPAATGSAALIMQQYKKTTGRFDIRHDVLKSIMVNTAVDKENVGPDFKVGFGMIDAKAAVDVVKTISTSKPLVTIGTISHKLERVYEFTVLNATSFKTTISWVDKEANPSNSVSLVNDIDMKLVNTNSGKIYYPFTLDKNTPDALAVKTKVNRVDNIEQIEVNHLPAGSYKLVVTGHKIISNEQEFAISSNSSIFGKGSIEVYSSELKNHVSMIRGSIK